MSAARAPQLGEFDGAGLVEVDEAAAFGVGGVEFAVQPVQFGSEQVVVNPRRDRDRRRRRRHAGGTGVRAGLPRQP
jgi:hypothetical protein